MKNINIKYNPYLLETTILVDGKAPKPNSKLNFGKLRIQEWSAILPQILLEECCDRNFMIEFTGTLSDLEDLKEVLLSTPNFQWSFISGNIKDSVSDVESKVDKIFYEIQNGPVEQLRDKSIQNAFQKAKNQEFEVDVVATMSAGKSTLINALLDKRLMPAAQKATTDKIVRIISSNQKIFTGKAFGYNNEIIAEASDLDYDTMQSWNSNPHISSIDIHGPIPCANSVGMRLVFVDTPGTNNSQNTRHQDTTYHMLEQSDKSLVLFVINKNQEATNDEKKLLDHISEVMKEKGKQSRDRYIFAVNKMDANPEENDIKKDIQNTKKRLEERGLSSPNLFPVSALAALECRTNPKVQMALPIYMPLLEDFPELHFENYYEVNNLPIPIKNEINGMLAQADEKGKVEIHSGIISIEQAIGLYINKYARTIKIKDLVDSFRDLLVELKAEASLEDDIRKNRNLKEELEDQIKKINQQIESGESAKKLKSKIENKSISEKAIDKINQYINKTSEKILDITLSYTSTKVKKEEAIRQIESIKKESREVIVQLGSRVRAALEEAYNELLASIINEYQNYLRNLGNLSSNLGLRPIDFVARELKDVTISTFTVDEGYDTPYEKWVDDKTRKKTNWFWQPSTWFTERYEKKLETGVEHTTINVEYVDMATFVKKYLKPIDGMLDDAKDAVKMHATVESERIKQILKNDIKKIENLLLSKLNDLQKKTESANQTKVEIEKQEQNLEWMKQIANRVDELIKF